LWLAIGVAVAATGCSRPAGYLAASAPNRFNPLVGAGNPLPKIEQLAGVDQTFQVPVGPPEASLSVSVVEPIEPGPPRGTVLVLHGIFIRSLFMMDTARMLSRAGYRAVLVDLRGHGRSSGQHLTYGIRESQDLSQVIDELQRRGLAEGPLGVYGLSYGATTAIHLAGRDPRIQAVVAVAPFATLRQELSHYMRASLVGLGDSFSEEAYQQVIDEAGRAGDFNPDEASAVAAIQRTAAPVLILHGTADNVIPYWHALQLQRAAPHNTEVVLIRDIGHISIWFDPTGDVASHTRGWFDRYLDNAALASRSPNRVEYGR
jgi:pimeloyl-ACP methyl ester carboxylesterase